MSPGPLGPFGENSGNSWMYRVGQQIIGNSPEPDSEEERQAKAYAKAAIEIRDCLVWDGNVPQFSYEDGVELRKMGLLP